jgi:putative restriction endonuclease
MGSATAEEREKLLRVVDGLRVWRRGGQRAPHKPLLVLLMLGRLRAGESRLVAFTHVEEGLRALLRHFGPPRRSHHPEMPFWHLRSEGIWELAGPVETLGREAGETPTVSAARRLTGGFGSDVWQLLRDDPPLVDEVARRLVAAHFAESLHSDILERVGLADAVYPTGDGSVCSAEGAGRLRRDPQFRVGVLRAYEYRCAVCRYDGRIDTVPVGLEAAHVRWHAAGGADDLGNGLALCSLHHKVFDLGVLGISPDGRVQVSQAFHGQRAAQRFVARFAGVPLLLPQSGLRGIAEDNRRWHEREVFRGPARAAVTAAAEASDDYEW